MISVGAVVCAWLILQAEPPTSTGVAWLDGLLQWGPLGLCVVGFVTGWIIPRPTHEAERERLREQEALVADYRRTMEQQVIPALTRVTDALAAAQHDRGRSGP